MSYLYVKSNISINVFELETEQRNKVVCTKNNSCPHFLCLNDSLPERY